MPKTIKERDDRSICGIDEAGRGALAGPLCAAAVQLGPSYPNDAAALLADSKQLSADQRAARALEIFQYAARWAISWATAAEIDEHNVLRATLMAMHRAYLLLCGMDTEPRLPTHPVMSAAGGWAYTWQAAPSQTAASKHSSAELPATPPAPTAEPAPSAEPAPPDMLTETAGMLPDMLTETAGMLPDMLTETADALPPLPQCVIVDGPHVPPLIDTVEVHGVVRADTTINAVQAASILAKTHRDAWMQYRAHRHFPQYGFYQHKGYPTQLHRQMIANHGASPIHRISFRGVRTTK